jgi:hypothetical protein
MEGIVAAPPRGRQGWTGGGLAGPVQARLGRATLVQALLLKSQGHQCGVVLAAYAGPTLGGHVIQNGSPGAEVERQV